MNFRNRHPLDEDIPFAAMEKQALNDAIKMGEYLRTALETEDRSEFILVVRKLLLEIKYIDLKFIRMPETPSLPGYVKRKYFTYAIEEINRQDRFLLNLAKKSKEMGLHFTNPSILDAVGWLYFNLIPDFVFLIIGNIIYKKGTNQEVIVTIDRPSEQ